MILYPDITPLSERRFRLEEDVSYLIKDHMWHIRAGYIYDGASIPRVAWSIIGLYPGGIMEEPSLVHDSMYRRKGDGVYARADADRCFFEMMLEYGVPRVRAGIAYAAVVCFGRRHWGGPSPYGGV